MRFIGSITEENVRKYIEDIHKDHSSSLQFLLNDRLNRLPTERKWLVTLVKLYSDIGTVKNIHDHHDAKTGDVLHLSSDEETWSEAFKGFEQRTNGISNHECLNRLENIYQAYKEDPVFFEKRPLLLELKSLNPVQLLHVDGYHRVFALIKGKESETELLSYIACPADIAEQIQSELEH
jgi:hypothetical protein